MGFPDIKAFATMANARLRMSAWLENSKGLPSLGHPTDLDLRSCEEDLAILPQSAGSKADSLFLFPPENA